MYRKYLEPEYGDVAPEVNIMEPQAMDMNNLRAWRTKSDFESISGMTAAMMKCNCYPKLMEVSSQDIQCEEDGLPFRVRIYNLDNQKTDKPVIIFYHGGAFAMNSIEVYEYVHRYLAYYGDAVIVAPDYHLAPEYKYPKGLLEAYQTLLWTAENITVYGGDPSAIFVCGDSSGGNFSACVSMMAKEKKGPAIKGQMLYYPLTTNYEEEMTQSEKKYETGYFLEYNCMKDPMAMYFTKEEERKDPYASPLLAEDLSGLPKACFISAECDPLLDQGLMFAAKLQDQGVSVEYHIMKGMVHGFLNWTYGKTFDAMNHAINFVKQ